MLFSVEFRIGVWRIGIYITQGDMGWVRYMLGYLHLFAGD